MSQIGVRIPPQVRRHRRRVDLTEMGQELGPPSSAAARKGASRASNRRRLVEQQLEQPELDGVGERAGLPRPFVSITMPRSASGRKVTRDEKPRVRHCG